MARKPLFRNTALLDEAMAAARPTLFSDDGNDYRMLDLDRIDPNPHQPRQVFDADKLAELAASIRANTLLQPVLVREVPGGRYQLISGERRLRACKLLGQSSIAAIVTRSDDPATLALVENLQREDLDALELAASLRKLLEQHGARQSTLAKVIGKSDAYVSRMLRLPDLPAEILADYPQQREKISASALAEIIDADGTELQLSLWQAAKSGLATKALRALRKQGGEAAAVADGAENPDAVTALDPDQQPTPAVQRGTEKLGRDLARLVKRGQPLTQADRVLLTGLRTQIDQLLSQISDIGGA